MTADGIPLGPGSLESPFAAPAEAEAGAPESHVLSASPFAGEADLIAEQEEPEVVFEDEEFPSGLVLQHAIGETGEGQEHWDPCGPGLPLLATGPETHGRRLSPSFTVRELVTSGGHAASVARIAPALVRLLQAMRDRAGTSVTIDSGYRSWARNVSVYRARGKRPTKSRHCSGQAADIRIAGFNGVQIAKLAIDVWGTALGIGIGENDAHVDVRPTPSVWTYPKPGFDDAAARREVQAYRASRPSGGHGRDSRPETPPVTQAGAAVAPAGRLVVHDHPALSAHAGTRPDLVMRWNTVPAGPVDVVVHLHGYSAHGSGMQLVRDKEPLSGLDFVDPSTGAPGRTRPTLALLPRGHFAGGKYHNRYTFPALLAPGALASMVLDGIARFTAHTGVAVFLDRLLLTAHSGGGAPLLAILKHADPDEVHVFDALYQPATELSRWADARIRREVTAPTAAVPALRVVYLSGTDTAKHTEDLARSLCRSLAIPGADRLAPSFRVDRTTVDHGHVPQRFGWALLKDNTAQLPRSTRLTCCEGKASEAAFAGEYLDPDEAGLAWLDVSEGESGDESPGWFGAVSERPDDQQEWFAGEGDQSSAEDAGPSSSGMKSAAHRLSGIALSDLLGFETEGEYALADRVQGAVGLVMGPTLKRGSKGPGVAALQRALIALGFSVAEDGAFGAATDTAVRKFQTQLGMTADGVVGVGTKLAIAAAAAGRGGPGPVPLSAGTAKPSTGALAPGDHVWFWAGRTSRTREIPAQEWFTPEELQRPGCHDYGCHGAEIFNFVLHAGGLIRRGQPHMKGPDGSSAWLNNNPGNIKLGGTSHGEYPGKANMHNFRIFPSFEIGFDAIAKHLRGKDYVDLSIAEAIRRWAPKGDGGNDPARYGASVAESVGAPIETTVRQLNDAQMLRMQTRIKQIEGWVPGREFTHDSPDLPDAIRAML